MISPTPSSPVRRGLIAGFKCPVSGREFVTDSDSREEREALFNEQQQFTYAAMQIIDSRFGEQSNINDYSRLFRALEQA